MSKNTTRKYDVPNFSKIGFLYDQITIKNKYLDIIKDYSFVNYSIKSLDLSSNQIETISNHSFDMTRDLNELYLNDNNIKSINNLTKSLSNIKYQNGYLKIFFFKI